MKFREPALAVFWLRCLLLSLLAAGPACGPKYEPLAVPEGGVRLAYDFSPGRTFEGHVRRAETASGAMGNLNRVLEYDVRLQILGKDPKRGDILVRATFHNVKIQWTLPPGAISISVDEFIEQAVRQVQGMEIRFNVGDDGSVHYLPPVPSEVDDELRLVIQGVLDSLDDAFLQVPDEPLQPGASWEEKEKKGRKGKLGRYRKGTKKTTFEGYFRDPKTGRKLAKLVLDDRGEEVITTKAGSRRNEWNGSTEAFFSLSDSFLAERHGELRKFDPKEGTTFLKVDVTWRKVADGTTAPAVQVERQAITDPCDPDYVGFDACPADEAAGGGDGTPPPPEQDAAAGEATEETEPAPDTPTSGPKEDAPKAAPKDAGGADGGGA